MELSSIGLCKAICGTVFSNTLCELVVSHVGAIFMTKKRKIWASLGSERGQSVRAWCVDCKGLDKVDASYGQSTKELSSRLEIVLVAGLT
jgi:hypothetical protein